MWVGRGASPLARAATAGARSLSVPLHVELVRRAVLACLWFWHWSLWFNALRDALPPLFAPLPSALCTI